jgi:hypothetical protein
MTDHYVAAPVAHHPAASGNAIALPPVHPPWCHPDSCSVGASGTGAHNSKPVDLRAEHPGALGIAVTLTQGTPTPGYPLSGVLLVDLTFTDTDDGYDFGTLPLDIDLAHRLGLVLTGVPETIAP